MQYWISNRPRTEKTSRDASLRRGIFTGPAIAGHLPSANGRHGSPVIAEIGDFRDAEINGVPALFTACRVDPITLPDGTYCYDIMGGRSSSFLNVVSLAPVYFTGAIVTLQPLLRGWQTFVEIRNYGIYGKTDFDEWRERWLR